VALRVLLSLEVIVMAADGTSVLEVASWVAGIGALLLATVAGLLYLVGKIRPLKCSAESEVGRHESGGPIVVVHVKATSRTRNAQTIRTMAIVSAPSAFRRLVRRRTYLDGRPATPFKWSTVGSTPDGVEISGHDSKDLQGHLYREEIPYGSDAWLVLWTSRKRPVLARIKPVR
jgi:hypothetical protein